MNSTRAIHTMNCDRVAPLYRVAEYGCFGRALERRRSAFLTDLASSRRTLICGGGDGRFLAGLLRANPDVEIDFVDLSSGMIRLAEKRSQALGTSHSNRVTFHAEDIRDFRPRSSYDLIATHFFLDCFSEAEIGGVVSRIAEWSDPGALWIVSEFRVAAHGLNRLWTAAVVKSLYAAFRIATGLRVTRLPNHARALREHGFRMLAEQIAFGGLLCSTAWRKED
jgi:ubiquinone/menaquinone biosynthesis C-methylase UbiE